jgi:hypothetical protein
LEYLEEVFVKVPKIKFHEKLSNVKRAAACEQTNMLETKKPQIPDPK